MTTAHKCGRLLEHKRWFIVSKKTVKSVSDEWADIWKQKEIRRKYVVERDEYKNSPKGKEEARKRKLVQDVYWKQEEERKAKVEYLEQFKEKLLNEILAELDLTNSNHQSVVLDETKVKQVMDKHQDELNFLKEESLKYEKNTHGYFSHIYVKLYRDLIAVNHLFIKFSPVEAVCKTGILPSLGMDTIRKYKDFFVENHYFENEKFKQINGRFFYGVDRISSLQDFDDVKKELKSAPELYPELSANMKYTIMHSELVIQSLLCKAPTVMKYMTDEEIYTVADKNPSMVGFVIARHPEVLDNFPSDFFKVNHPKAIFSRVTRADVHNAGKDYYNKFPELYEYMRHYVEKLNASKENDADLNLV